jgi:hypothetical protein
MAYLRKLDVKCSRPSCSSLARFELVNRRGAPCGRFCARCARQRLREAEREEAADDRRDAVGDVMSS